MTKYDKRILVFSNYPIKEPLHGGQKRVAAIIEEYKKHFKAVKFVALFVKEHYPVYDSEDIYLTGSWATRVRGDHLTSDIQIGNAIRERGPLRKRVSQVILDFKPDIIEFEQAFPYYGIKDILDELPFGVKIVYNSQNVEAPMRRDIMKLGKAKQEDINKVYKIIDNLEVDLANNADFLAVVSEDDGEYYANRGAKKYVLAANGISEINSRKDEQQKWRQQFNNLNITNIAIFIGSGHLPNMAGIHKMVGMQVGFLPSNTRLVLAGGAGLNLKENFDYNDMLAAPFWRRVMSVGILPQLRLEGLIGVADIIILPIVDGGGSNLKTAEAILSGKKIVGTSFAFRGYEQYLELPNIWIADFPDAFRNAIAEALSTPNQKRSDAQQKLAEQVKWQYSLRNLIEEVGKL